MKKHLPILSLITLVTILAAGCATQTASKPEAAPTNVTVTYQEPDKFTDARRSFGSGTDQGYLDILSEHLKKAAGMRITPDQKLEITVTDVDLAGDFIPSGRPSMDDIRIIKDLYRPRITLTFKLTGADGAVIKEGARTLSDSFFMNNVGLVGRNEPLYYDKAMLDTWVRDEFKS